MPLALLLALVPFPLPLLARSPEPALVNERPPDPPAGADFRLDAFFEAFDASATRSAPPLLEEPPPVAELDTLCRFRGPLPLPDPEPALSAPASPTAAAASAARVIRNGEDLNRLVLPLLTLALFSGSVGDGIMIGAIPMAPAGPAPDPLPPRERADTPPLAADEAADDGAVETAAPRCCRPLPFVQLLLPPLEPPLERVLARNTIP